LCKLFFFFFPSGSIRRVKARPLKLTGRELDIAVQGEGYLKILSPKGQRYTLDGSMYLNKERMLVDAKGNIFLDVDSRAIEIPLNSSSIVISDNGTIICFNDNDEKEEVAQIGIFVVDSTQLQRKGENLFSAKNLGNDFISDDYQIKQKMLCASNVDTVRSIAELNEIENSFNQATSIISSAFNIDKSTVELINRSR